MPFLHLDIRNQHKEAWLELVKDHPAHFEVLEWSAEHDRDLIQRSFPNLDTQLFPRICVSILAALEKLVNYGGIVVRGDDVAPVRGLRILLNDWKTLGPPRRLTVRGYAYPVIIDKTTIMTSKPADTVCRKYRDQIVKCMLSQVWEQPVFTDDVGIM